MAFEGWAGGKCSTKAQQSSEILQTKYITRLFNSNLYFVGFPTTEPGFPRVLSQRRMHFSFSSTLAANFGSHWLSCPPRRQETSERMNRISKASGDDASSNSRWGQPERAVWSQWHGRITTGTSCPVQSAIRRRTTAGKKREKLATCVMSAVLRCTQGKQLIDCTTENKMRHDETACSLRSCQPFVLFSPVNESKRFSKRIDLSMADKLMSFSGNEDSTGAPLHSQRVTRCNRQHMLLSGQ